MIKWNIDKETRRHWIRIKRNNGNFLSLTIFKVFRLRTREDGTSVYYDLCLGVGPFQSIGRFKKLRSAKACAQLIIKG
jgi:hypothetical protein